MQRPARRFGIMHAVNQPNPALVTHRAAERLPRLPLWLLCIAYVWPGVIGRDPWRNADLTAYGYMLSMAEGRSSWWVPTLGGQAGDVVLLPHWLGAGFIRLLGPWLGPELAARVPFALLLGATLALVWYATLYLARTEAAQPVRFAFGGEANTLDYARALADGSLLATVATLGLLQLGHETTPELVQLSEAALLVWGLAISATKPRLGKAAAGLALPLLALSGAPAMAVLMGLAALLASHGATTLRGNRVVLVVSLLVAVALSTATQAWQWRVDLPDSFDDWKGLLQLLLWFTWPVWPFALWTLWRWRGHLRQAHIAIPTNLAAAALVSCLVMGGSDRALMLAVPALAVLAAFALPTLKRSASAAVDWFSVFFFSIAALAIWVTYSSMHWGLPAKPLANILKLAPGFQPKFQGVELVLAALGTLAWLWLVRWRTAQHRHPLWKSLVLPASGVALSWLLTMTLLLPVLDYARSPKPLVARLLTHLPAGHCLVLVGGSKPMAAGLEVFGQYRVRSEPAGYPVPTPEHSACDAVLVLSKTSAAPPTPTGWRLVTRIKRPTDRNEQSWLYRPAP